MNFKIFTPSDNEISLSDGKNVLALGTFDGVHIAHRALLESAVEFKRTVGAAKVGAWCFSDTPASFFKKESSPLLTSLDERISLLLTTGLDFVAVGDFADFCTMRAEDFINDVLISELNCVGAVCGFNHRFGIGAAGDSKLLKDMLGSDKVLLKDEIKYDGTTVSSSAIRALISSGEIEKANCMLGRPYSVRAKVVKGKQLGRKLQFPTANIFFPSSTIPPKSGIYATVCQIDGERYIGVSNVGIRPTITDGTDAHAFNCETYIVDFSGDLYDRDLTVEFHKYIRDEMQFSSLDELKAQISKDTETALAYFN